MRAGLQPGRRHSVYRQYDVQHRQRRCDPGGMVCTGDGQCNPPGTICDLNSGACVAGCSTTGCPSPQTCNTQNGHCVDPQNPQNLPLNAACTSNAECTSSVCFDFQGTVGKRCVSACGSSQDCPAAFTCYDFNGGKMCISSQLFTGATFATQNGGSCANGGECHSNYCPNNTCVDTCSESSDCGGAQCKWDDFAQDTWIGACNGPLGNGANGASCAADADCRGGVCYGSGTCGDLCGSTADCPNGNICILVNYSVCLLDFFGACFGWQPNFVKACVSSAHGNGAVGATCTEANQCRSGLCLLVPSTCTDTCSRDADCPSSHVCGVQSFGELNVSGGDPVPVYINVCYPRGQD
jgi:hypothetical protein